MPAGTRDHASEESIFDYTGFRVIMYKEENDIIELADIASIGDFVNYDAGNWASTLSRPTTDNTFGPYTLGESKNITYNFYEGDNNIYSGGWRILDIDEEKTITLVHAGSALGYMHRSY